MSLLDGITNAGINALSGGLGIAIAKAMTFLGISFVSTQYAGPAIVEMLTAQLSGIGGDALQIAVYLGVDDAIAIVGSALAQKLITKLLITSTAAGVAP